MSTKFPAMKKDANKSILLFQNYSIVENEQLSNLKGGEDIIGIEDFIDG